MSVYNPVDYNSLADGIASVFMQQPLEPLSEFRRETGSGVYAFYYGGPFPEYALLAKNFSEESFLKVPIYVGKAMPQGNKGLPLVEDEQRVVHRIQNHRRDYVQIGVATDLHVRYLILSPVWVVLAETHLIRMFQPLWNRVVQGKGSNVQGGNRQSEPSDWDVLHPGRGRDNPSQLQDAIRDRQREIKSRVIVHFEQYFAKEFQILRARLGTGFVHPDPQGAPMAEPPV